MNQNRNRRLEWEKSHTERADKLIAGLPELIRDAMRDDFFNRIDAAMDLG